MTEAVIVATARSPIGRAGKGSLRNLRPDDLAAQMVRAVLAKVPELDPREIDGLMLGTAQPAGEAGYNLGLAVGVLSGKPPARRVRASPLRCPRPRAAPRIGTTRCRV